MKVTRFKTSEPLIFIKGYVWGIHDRRQLRLVFDPGATETILNPDILDDLGYNPRHGEKITMTRSVVGQESGYLIRVVRFRSLGFDCSNFRINALDLPGDYEFQYDGLLGLNFLRNFNYEVRSREGRILAERLEP